MKNEDNLLPDIVREKNVFAQVFQKVRDTIKKIFSSKQSNQNAEQQQGKTLEDHIYDALKKIERDLRWLNEALENRTFSSIKTVNLDFLDIKGEMIGILAAISEVIGKENCEDITVGPEDMPLTEFIEQLPNELGIEAEKNMLVACRSYRDLLGKMAKTGAIEGIDTGDYHFKNLPSKKGLKWFQERYFGRDVTGAVESYENLYGKKIDLSQYNPLGNFGAHKIGNMEQEGIQVTEPSVEETHESAEAVQPSVEVVQGTSVVEIITQQFRDFNEQLMEAKQGLEGVVQSPDSNAQYTINLNFLNGNYPSLKGDLIGLFAATVDALGEERCNEILIGDKNQLTLKKTLELLPTLLNATSRKEMLRACRRYRDTMQVMQEAGAIDGINIEDPAFKSINSMKGLKWFQDRFFRRDITNAVGEWEKSEDKAIDLSGYNPLGNFENVNRSKTDNYFEKQVLEAAISGTQKIFEEPDDDAR